MANPFDQFDEPKKVNPFDRFDNLPPAGSFIENPELQDTQQISAITGKPEQQYVATDYQPASMATLMKAGFVDNNDSKIKLFAEARGINPSKYKVHQGKIYFEGDDGRYYPESPKSIDGVLKQFLAGVPSELPAEAGATIGGALGGPVGAAAGGAGGEFIRKSVGRAMGDEQTGMDYAGDMGLNALLGGLDATVAKTIMNAASKAKISHATKGALTDNLKNVVGDITPEQKAAGKILSQKGQNIGVDLKPHQAMDDPTLTSYYEMLRQNPKTARQVIASDKTLESQVENAGNSLLQKIYNGETSPFEVGAELSDMGEKIIRKEKDRIYNEAKPFYDKARKVDGVDITPVLSVIEDIKRTAKPGMKVRSAINRIEKMLRRGMAVDEVMRGSGSGQVDMSLIGREAGHPIGRLDYSEFNSKPSVQMLEVPATHQRRGVATKLLSEMQNRYPDQEIDMGMLTNDGGKLIDSLKKRDIPRNDIIKKQKKLTEIEGKLESLEEKSEGIPQNKKPNISTARGLQKGNQRLE